MPPSLCLLAQYSQLQATFAQPNTVPAEYPPKYGALRTTELTACDPFTSIPLPSLPLFDAVSFVNSVCGWSNFDLWSAFHVDCVSHTSYMTSLQIKLWVSTIIIAVLFGAGFVTRKAKVLEIAVACACDCVTPN